MSSQTIISDLEALEQAIQEKDIITVYEYLNRVQTGYEETTLQDQLQQQELILVRDQLPVDGERVTEIHDALKAHVDTLGKRAQFSAATMWITLSVEIDTVLQRLGSAVSPLVTAERTYQSHLDETAPIQSVVETPPALVLDMTIPSNPLPKGMTAVISIDAINPGTASLSEISLSFETASNFPTLEPRTIGVVKGRETETVEITAPMDATGKYSIEVEGKSDDTMTETVKQEFEVWSRTDYLKSIHTTLSNLIQRLETDELPRSQSQSIKKQLEQARRHIERAQEVTGQQSTRRVSTAEENIEAAIAHIQGVAGENANNRPKSLSENDQFSILQIKAVLEKTKTYFTVVKEAAE